MKVGDKLIYRLNSNIPFNQTFEPLDDAYYYKKSYEIKQITDNECYFVDELGDDDFFYLNDHIVSDYYIWEHFYHPTEIRMKKLNSL